MADEKKPTNENQETIDARTHRRLLQFINAARTPQDLAFAPQNDIPPAEAEPIVRRPDVREQREAPEKLIEFGQALSILEARDSVSPLQGFAHIDQLRELVGRQNLTKYLNYLLGCMGPSTFGQWSTVGPIQDDKGQVIDVVHAAMLRTGWVMFIEAACGLAASRTLSRIGGENLVTPPSGKP